MSRQASTIETLIRRAFGLLLEMRGQPEAARRLSLAVAFLAMLLRTKTPDTPPVVTSVEAFRLPRFETK